MKLRARQSSEVARVVLDSTAGGSHFWRFYTHSQGGTKWDGRRYRSPEAASTAARESGFCMVIVEDKGVRR